MDTENELKSDEEGVLPAVFAGVPPGKGAVDLAALLPRSLCRSLENLEKWSGPNGAQRENGDERMTGVIILMVSGVIKVRKCGCFPLTHHLGGDFDHGEIMRPV